MELFELLFPKPKDNNKPKTPTKNNPDSNNKPITLDMKEGNTPETQEVMKKRIKEKVRKAQEEREERKKETEDSIKLLISKFKDMEVSSSFSEDQRIASIKKWKLLLKLSKLPKYSEANVGKLTKLDLKVVFKIVDKHTRPWRYERRPIHMSEDLKKEYLKSDDWYNLKAKRLKLANNQCEVKNCPNTKNLQLHHVHYFNLGNEDIEDVRIVCSQCHESLHDELGYKRTEYYHI